MFLNWESPSSLIGAQHLCVDWTSSFFIRFEGIGCIRVATILYGYCKQQSLFEQFDMSHSVD